MRIDPVEINGRRALLTGASRGVGREMAFALASRGARLLLHARTQTALEPVVCACRDQGVEVHTIAAELADPAGVEAVADAADALGGVDILINNAGLMCPWSDTLVHGVDAWNLTIQVMLIAPVRLCERLVPGMRDRGWGRVVNLTTGMVEQPQLVPYSAAKAGLDKYTTELAYALRETAIRVNLLDPGWLRTDLGGPAAPNDVSTVLPGAMVPVLCADDGPTGQLLRAQELREAL